MACLFHRAPIFSRQTVRYITVKEPNSLLLTHRSRHRLVGQFLRVCKSKTPLATQHISAVPTASKQFHAHFAPSKFNPLTQPNWAIKRKTRLAGYHPLNKTQINDTSREKCTHTKKALGHKLICFYSFTMYLLGTK